jgi:protein-disulfide isomerase
MTSGKAARRQRQAAARPPVRSTGGRQASTKVLLGAAAVVVLIAVAVVVAIVATRGSSKSSATPTPLPDSASAVAMMHGIPQNGAFLGKPTAPVKMLEYIDLQCSSCQAFETQVMPTIIDKYVRTGKLQVEARPIVVIGPDSERGARAMSAAAKQNRGFTLAQILYYNQGPENGGWLTDQTVDDAAAGVPGLSLAAFQKAYGSAGDAVKQFNSQASTDNVGGTPTVYVSKGSGPRTVVAPGLIPSVQQMSAAIDAKLNQ